MALMPLEGKPGQFVDTTTREIISIVEWREDDKYDTQVVGPTVFSAAFAIPSGKQLTFFRDLQDKELVDTNLRTTRKIPAGEKMRIERIGVYIPLALGNTIVSPSNIKKVAENAYMLFQINRKDVIEGVLTKFGSGYGLSGSTTETNAGILGIGVPSTAAAAKLLREHAVDESHDLDAVIQFQTRTWAKTALGGAFPSDNPILTENTAGGGDAFVPIKVFLHGLIRSAATKG